MSADKMTISDEVRAVKAARWAGFQRLARQMPNHHVLGVELVRTVNDETAAVFTVVRDGEAIQCVVMGDSRGRLKPGRCEIPPADPGTLYPDGVALGEPPVKQPPTPGIVTLGGTILSLTFGVGEDVPVDPPQ
jgi:hypothetical protein